MTNYINTFKENLLKNDTPFSPSLGLQMIGIGCDLYEDWDEKVGTDYEMITQSINKGLDVLFNFCNKTKLNEFILKFEDELNYVSKLEAVININTSNYERYRIYDLIDPINSHLSEEFMNCIDPNNFTTNTDEIISIEKCLGSVLECFNCSYGEYEDHFDEKTKLYNWFKELSQKSMKDILDELKNIQTDVDDLDNSISLLFKYTDNDYSNTLDNISYEILDYLFFSFLSKFGWNCETDGIFESCIEDTTDTDENLYIYSRVSTEVQSNDNQSVFHNYV